MEIKLKAYSGAFGNPIPRPETVTVPDLKAASRVVRKWIDNNGLGGSQVGHIKVHEGKKLIALISYNGRIWTTEKDWKKRKEIIIGEVA